MKFWFGRKAAPGGGRPFLARGFGAEAGVIGGGAGDWPQHYEGQVRAAFLNNPVAQRAVKLVAEGVASCVLYANGDDGADAPAVLLTPAVLETVAAHLLLHGNAFVQIIEHTDGTPERLFPLRPERVRVETDGRGWPVAFRYKVGANESRIAATDALGRPGLLHLKSFHPLDDHYGLGCLQAAAGAVAIHNEATRWNKALLANAARPSGALVYAPGDGSALAGEQYQRLKAELEASYQGAGNAARPMLLEGGMDWKALSLTPAEMDFAGLKAAAARDIALAFGVPPMLIGLPGDNTYANYKEANRALWRLTILPMAGRIADAIGGGLAAWWPGLRILVDADQVSALGEEREALWRQVSAADFLTRREKRDMLGFGKD